MLVAGSSPADQDWLAEHQRLEGARERFAATAPGGAAAPGQSEIVHGTAR
jgi:hypothetical protein